LDDLPSQYVNTTITTAADKNKIRDDLKAGKIIHGASIKTNYSVTIK